MLRDPSWIIRRAAALLQQLETAAADGHYPVSKAKQVREVCGDLLALARDADLSKRGEPTRSFDIKCQPRN